MLTGPGSGMRFQLKGYYMVVVQINVNGFKETIGINKIIQLGATWKSFQFLFLHPDGLQIHRLIWRQVLSASG